MPKYSIEQLMPFIKQELAKWQTVPNEQPNPDTINNNVVWKDYVKQIFKTISKQTPLTWLSDDYKNKYYLIKTLEQLTKEWKVASVYSSMEEQKQGIQRLSKGIQIPTPKIAKDIPQNPNIDTQDINTNIQNNPNQSTQTKTDNKPQWKPTAWWEFIDWAWNEIASWIWWIAWFAKDTAVGATTFAGQLVPNAMKLTVSLWKGISDAVNNVLKKVGIPTPDNQDNVAEEFGKYIDNLNDNTKEAFTKYTWTDPKSFWFQLWDFVWQVASLAAAPQLNMAKLWWLVKQYPKVAELFAKSPQLLQKMFWTTTAKAIWKWLNASVIGMWDATLNSASTKWELPNSTDLLIWWWLWVAWLWVSKAIWWAKSFLKMDREWKLMELYKPWVKNGNKEVKKDAKIWVSLLEKVYKEWKFQPAKNQEELLWQYDVIRNSIYPQIEKKLKNADKQWFNINMGDVISKTIKQNKESTTIQGVAIGSTIWNTAQVDTLEKTIEAAKKYYWIDKPLNKISFQEAEKIKRYLSVVSEYSSDADKIVKDFYNKFNKNLQEEIEAKLKSVWWNWIKDLKRQWIALTHITDWLDKKVIQAAKANQWWIWDTLWLFSATNNLANGNIINALSNVWATIANNFMKDADQKVAHFASVLAGKKGRQAIIENIPYQKTAQVVWQNVANYLDNQVQNNYGQGSNIDYNKPTDYLWTEKIMSTDYLNNY